MFGWAQSDGNISLAWASFARTPIFVAVSLLQWAPLSLTEEAVCEKNVMDTNSNQSNQSLTKKEEKYDANAHLGRGLPSAEPSFKPALLALVLSINLATFGSMTISYRSLR